MCCFKTEWCVKAVTQTSPIWRLTYQYQKIMLTWSGAHCCFTSSVYSHSCQSDDTKTGAELETGNLPNEKTFSETSETKTCKTIKPWNPSTHWSINCPHLSKPRLTPQSVSSSLHIQHICSHLLNFTGICTFSLSWCRIKWLSPTQTTHHLWETQLLKHNGPEIYYNTCLNWSFRLDQQKLK